MSVAMPTTPNKKKSESAPLNAFSLSDNQLLSAYETMYRSRVLDEKMLILLKQGKSYFHIGAMGHEAVQVACAMAMKAGTDFLFPYYRDQALCLALGQSTYEFFLSFLAREGDPHAAGRQMPMHYGNKALNIPTSSSSTGTQFLQAVGCSFANARLNQATPKDPLAITVCTTGEGTTSQGEFYEALSWAAREKAPIVFLVENNRYAISVNINEQRPGGRVVENFENFFGLKVLKVDGCDLLASYKVLSEAFFHARSGLGPCLVEADVVRLLPHSSSDDHKKYRSEDDLVDDKARDPVALLRAYLLKNKIANEASLKALEENIKENIDEEALRALKAPEPSREDATRYVWSEEKRAIPNERDLAWESEPTVLVDAVNRALKEALAANDKVLVFGQDVAHGKGGVFTATRNLSAQFGTERCFNAPLAEASIVGVAIGLALRGFRPVPEIQFGDYIWTAMMQIRNELATIRYRSNNDFSAPVVLRVPIGGYIHGGLCHSQNIEATFAHFPGLKIALPSTALDAYGLLKNAINGDDPVLFLEHKALYRQSFARSCLPEGTAFEIPFGKGVVRQSGEDITVITYGILVQRALEAAQQVADSLSVEVIDLRTIVPYDRELVWQSVRKTGKVLVLHEDMRFMGFGAEIASDIAEHCFLHLDAPVKRLAAKDSPVPYNSDLEEEVLPQIYDIVRELKDLGAF